MKRTIAILGACAVGISAVLGGEKTIVSLRNFSDVELKSAGIVVSRPVTVHIKALGGGAGEGWTYKSDRMYAYGWILNAETRGSVWQMNPGNTWRASDDRGYDGTVTLEPGSYEVYFTAYAFDYHTAFTHISVNVDHRESPLFGSGGERYKGFLSWFTDWWSDDIAHDWERRSPAWGMDLLVDDRAADGISMFRPPKPRPNVVVQATGLGDNEIVRKGFSVSGPTTLQIYAIGEGKREGDMMDYGWIVNASDRTRVWEMRDRSLASAGGSRKNLKTWANVPFTRGDYVLYYVTDDSHSAADWNEAPPEDPLEYGVTVSTMSAEEMKSVRPFDYTEDRNVIVAITKVRDNEHRSAGFTLEADAKVRVYAFGERSNSRRLMADYGTIMDAKTRTKIWTMDVDRTLPAGGASKNRYIDEVISLPRGSYIVMYQSDDSHSYEGWNDAAPFDPEHYGITVMGAGEHFSPSIVGRYVEERDRNVVARIVRVGNDADRAEKFTLNKSTLVRIYAIGEGQNREMYDYGWIENAKTGNVVWEMTYGMTFHAGGGRKNRMVNTTIMLDKGDYVLRFRSDDSHSFNDWNVDPPEDPEYWGITLYRDDGTLPSVAPVPPANPLPPDDEGDE
jgi:hypothetical protein